MRRLRVALMQVNPTVGDLAGNLRLVLEGMARADREEADLVVFPELCLTGYPPEDLVLDRGFVQENLRTLADAAAQAGEAAVVVGFVDRDARGIHNAAAVLWRRRVRGVYHKVLLPNYGVFDEKRTFAPGRRYPLFEVAGGRVGISICEDAWEADGPVRTLARRGAEVIVNINGSPYHVGKGREREALFRRRARESGAWFLYLQTVGGQDELVFDGESLAFDPRGRLAARGAQFREDRILLDLALPARRRRLAPGARPVRLGAPRADRRPLPPRPVPPRMPLAEEVYSALVLGVGDYVAKNGFSRVVLGLSGGIDSSLTAVVAADALGAENVLGVAMPSEVSSGESLEDAKELATNLGIEFRVLPIGELHRAFLDALAETFAGTTPNVAEENLQARIRGHLLMAISNKFGHLVLATGNKSEMATGYSTLYGDLAGGFAVLKDVPKTLVYQVARWRDERGPAAIPARVFSKPPSAELRPGQRDTDSLPPYEVLDPIIHAYVEERRSVDEIARKGFDRETVARVAELVDRSEYKRRQAPPGIKITPLAFGKDRRMPITNRYRQPSGAATARSRGDGRARRGARARRRSR